MKKTLVILSALTLAASGAAAQSPDEPSLVFTVTAGLSTGSGLWRIPQQPQPVAGSNPFTYDTLALGRRLRPGIVAGLAATYYRSQNFGFTAEVTYFGFGSEQECRGPAFYRDTVVNRAACNNAQGAHVATSIVGFLVGGTYRFARGHRVQPYVRATAGPGLLGNSYIQTSGAIVSPTCGTANNICSFGLLVDDHQKQFTYIINLSAGATVWLSPAYRFRFEVRDLLTSIPAVSGARDPLGPPVAPAGNVMKNIPTVVMGFDVVLERGHQRRY